MRPDKPTVYAELQTSSRVARGLLGGLFLNPEQDEGAESALHQSGGQA